MSDFLTQSQLREWLQALGDAPCGAFLECPLERCAKELMPSIHGVGSRTYLYDDKSANLPPWAAEYVVRIDAEPEPWSELKASRALELLDVQP